MTACDGRAAVHHSLSPFWGLGLVGPVAWQVIDTWVDLSTSGKVHLIVEYEPYGQDPEVCT